LIPVPDLYLRRSAQVDAAVGFGHGLVFDQELDVAEFLVTCRVRAVAVVDQFIIFNGPVLGKFGALPGEVGVAFLAGFLRNGMRIQAVPAGEVFAVENGAEALWRARVPRKGRRWPESGR